MNEMVKNIIQAVAITAATSVVSAVILKKLNQAMDKKDEKKAKGEYSKKTRVSSNETDSED